MNFQHKQRAFHSYVPPLHASRLFWPDFNGSFLCSAALLDIFQEQKSWGDAKSDSSCHLDYGLIRVLRRTIIQVIRKWGNPVLPLLPRSSYHPGQRCGHRCGQVRNGPSEKQPITKNWAFMSQFSVLFQILEGSPLSEPDVTSISLKQRKQSINLSACQCYKCNKRSLAESDRSQKHFQNFIYKTGLASLLYWYSAILH